MNAGHASGSQTGFSGYINQKPQTIEGIKIPFCIDGKIFNDVKIKRIRVNRLLKSDGEQATIPIQTYLPFSQGDM